MATDGISFSLFTKPFTDMTVEANKVTDKATMFALRSTGRFIQRAAKAKAPVYHGPDPRAQAESGNLKKSIRNSKRLVKLGTGSYSMKVGPFGTKKAGTAIVRHGTKGALSNRKDGSSTKGQVRGVQLYRGKMEEKYGYMAAGIAVADGAAARAIFEDAYAKAFARFR